MANISLFGMIHKKYIFCRKGEKHTVLFSQICTPNINKKKVPMILYYFTLYQNGSSRKNMQSFFLPSCLMEDENETYLADIKISLSTSVFHTVYYRKLRLDTQNYDTRTSVLSQICFHRYTQVCTVIKTEEDNFFCYEKMHSWLKSRYLNTFFVENIK